jgi:antitoxin ChpS
MDITLRKFGNSTGIAFPPGLLKSLGLRVGQSLTLDSTDDGRLLLTPKQLRPRLADLLAQCDLSAPPPADLALWDCALPVGREVW